MPPSGSDDPLDPARVRAWYAAAAPPSGAAERAVRRVAQQRTGLRLLVPGGWRAAASRAAGLAAAVALVALGVRTAVRPGRAGHELTATSVRIELHEPTAREVALVGDFNAWSRDRDLMQQDARAGVWRAELRLPPGRHAYAFVVDGTRWTIDPLAPQSDASDFGALNIVIVPRGM